MTCCERRKPTCAPYVEHTQGEKLSVQHEKQVLYELFSGLKQRYAQADNHAVQSFSAVETKLKKNFPNRKKGQKIRGPQGRNNRRLLLSVHEKMVPGGTLAERKHSILEFLGLLGSSPAETLVERANPLESGLKLILF